MARQRAVRLPFHAIQVNVTPEGREIIFPVKGEWYRMPWGRVPERFKELYVALLRLQGARIPPELWKYARDDVKLGDLTIELDLRYAERLEERW